MTMSIIEEIRHLFSTQNISCSDRLTVCDIHFDCKANLFPSFDKVEAFINLYSFSNELKLQITTPDDIFELSSSSVSCEEYNRVIQTFEEEDILKICIYIDKKIVDHRLYVYCYEEFVHDILSNGLINLIDGLSGLIENAGYLLVYILDKNINWHTKTILFTNNLESSFNQLPNRDALIKERHNNAYFRSVCKAEVLPEDFSIVVDYENNPLRELFNNAKTLLSLAYISSSSDLEDNKLVGVINGQRSLSYEVTLDSLKDNNIIYRIYSWIYTDGNPIDKAIIARNIISLHCRYCSLLDVDYKTLTSITSNYGFYLKDNVNRYLEAKTKVSEFISDIVSRLGESALGITKSLITNLVAMLSFFLTVVLTSVVTGNSFDTIFTDDVLLIFKIILIGSLAFYILSLLGAIYKRQKIKFSYDSLRENYKDLLSEEELIEVFDHNGLYKKCLSTMAKSMVISSIVWIGILIILWIVIEYKELGLSARSLVLYLFRLLVSLFT